MRAAVVSLGVSVLRSSKSVACVELLLTIYQQQRNNYNSMAATTTFSNVVDLAIGTPEIGAVNFNVLNYLLHAVLAK